MMIRYSKLVVYITALALSAWLLPWLFDFSFSKPASLPFTLYSCVTHDFAFIDRSSGQPVYKDEAGTIYTNNQFDSILPTFYYRQLMADDRLPQEIDGKPVDARMIQQGNFVFRQVPAEINLPKVPLYSLLEGMSGRVDLAMPDDVFRLTDRMEFIDIVNNTVNEEKSNRYTQALLDKGFVFPARYVAGNPTTRKDYDEGYLVIDNTYQVFHVKRLRDRPFVRNTGISPDLKMKYAFVTEFRNRRFYGILTDGQNRAYVLEAKSYGLKPLPLESYDPEKQSITVFGDAFYWTVQVSSEREVKWYAVRSDDYLLAGQKSVALDEDRSERIAAYIFPFQLSFTSYADKFVYPRVTAFSGWALLLNFLLAGAYAVRRRKNLTEHVFGVILLLLFGVFALFPVLLLGQKEIAPDRKE